MEFRAVLVSTVRSRHRVSQMADGVVGAFGFLSESQLVNTALTRAKSWLAVVGDPVALCSIGNCGTLWRTYLKHCQKADGIHPPDLSLDDIWQHSQSLTNLLTVSTVNDSVIGNLLSQISLDPHSQSQDIARASPLLTLETTSSVSVSTSSASSSAAASAMEPYKTISVGDSQQRPSTYTSKTSSIQSSEIFQSHRTSAQRAATQAQSQPQDRGRRAMSEHSSSVESDADEKGSRSVTSARRAAAAAAGVGRAAMISFDEWSMDYRLEPDEIFRQLVKVCILVSFVFVQVLCCALMLTYASRRLTKYIDSLLCICYHIC